TSTSSILTLPLHDALPIFFHLREDGLAIGTRGFRRGIIATAQHQHAYALFQRTERRSGLADVELQNRVLQRFRQGTHGNVVANRSEEHTSELQSRENLVCR